MVLGFGIDFLRPTELIIILAVALLLFGSRLPTIARSLGKSIVEFKKGMKDVKDELTSDAEEPKKLEDKSREVEASKVEKVEKVEKTESESEAEKVSS